MGKKNTVISMHGLLSIHMSAFYNSIIKELSVKKASIRWQKRREVKLLEAESTRTVDNYGEFEPMAPSKSFCVGVGIFNVIVDGIADTHLVDSLAPKRN
ncbi:hypothetical protein VNO77_34120 [Canavalia gladiata]|uniref:Uncharacterized protein n=1 Tax=Canavalia gladiata TaxID=3824 RepID=A0AAN9KDS8_CANGL